MFSCQPRPNRIEHLYTHTHIFEHSAICSCKHTTHVKCNKRVYQFCTRHAAPAVSFSLRLLSLATAVGMPMSCQTAAATTATVKNVQSPGSWPARTRKSGAHQWGFIKNANSLEQPLCKALSFDSNVG